MLRQQTEEITVTLTSIHSSAPPSPLAFGTIAGHEDFETQVLAYLADTLPESVERHFLVEGAAIVRNLVKKKCSIAEEDWFIVLTDIAGIKARTLAIGNQIEQKRASILESREKREKLELSYLACRDTNAPTDE
ncbi:MAG: hypothetical protein WC477_04840 [Patescibacteria group bacterium]